MTSSTKAAVRTVVLFGAVSGLLVAAMQLARYHFLVVDRSVEVYAAIVAGMCAAAGIWLGVRLTRRPAADRRPTAAPVAASGPAPAAAAFARNTATVQALGLTPRELDVLDLIAEGLSTKEMAARLFVSENTVKTHVSRVLDKLGASRRTQAVQRGKQLGLIA